MSNTKEIPVFHPTFDFDTLMREAQKHITELAGELWSDHNPSDPGITQLEVLAFCIADLSYRTSFDVKDILAGYKGGLTELHDLPLANVALPNHPVSIKDLRKLLVDMAHPQYLATQHLQNEDDHYETKLLVRNAFPIIAEENEVPFYAVSKYGNESFLTFDTSFEKVYTELEVAENQNEGPSKMDGGELFEMPTEAPSKRTSAAAYSEKANVQSEKSAIEDIKQAGQAANAASSATRKVGIRDIPKVNVPFTRKTTHEFNYLDQIQLNGLYSIQIEFEEDVHFKDNPTERFLRDLNFNYFVSPIQHNGVDYRVNVLMPYWDDIRWSLKDVDLSDSDTQIEYESRLKHDYLIAVDKLNYDDYFYDYYAEVNLAGHVLPLFIKTEFTDDNGVAYQGIPDSITVGGKTYRFIAKFLDWNELSNGVNQNYSGSGNSHLLQPNLGTSQTNLAQWPGLEIFPVSIEGEATTYDIKSVFEFKKERVVTDDNGNVSYLYEKDKKINLLTRIIFEEGTLIGDGEKSQIEAALLAKFPNLFHQQVVLEQEVKTELQNKTAQIYVDYLAKIKRVFELLYRENGIWSYLGKYRNLCEDFAQFSASRVQEIALFGKLIVAPNHNVNELLAEIYFRVDQFLNPLVKFWALGEMVEKGYKFEELFNGPELKNGFIEDSDLNNLKRRSVVYTSDLIRIIMDVDGVEAVENFNISSYIDNRLMGRNVLNCLSLTNSDIYKPRFTAEKTQFEVWVNDEKQDLNEDSIEGWYKEKISNAKANQISNEDNGPLAVPQGRDMEIEAYYSVQHDFPEVYGIGNFGLPKEATEERKSRAKQLKGYLLPFEQLLANYLKQIAHLPELFSFSRNIDRTYQHQPLYNVPDVAPLFAPFKQSNTTWDVFKDDIDNAYEKQLRKGESEELFRDRRNRFLNQLLARFGESFMAYSTQMFDRNKALLNNADGIGDFKAARSNTLKKLIDDQITFAEDYPQVSGERYKAFDTTRINKGRNVGQWNNSNIASYKRRLCRLLGINKINNGSIFLSKLNDDGKWIDEEGMHIVEHILLRPRTAQSELMNLRNEPIADAEGSFIYDSEKDPYSFRITIVLPRYAGRFTEKPFRQFTEHLIQMETPAHIRVDFKWLSGDCGKKFEESYSLWKENIYKLKPYFFGNITSWDQIKHEDLLTDHLKKNTLKLVPEIPVSKINRKISKADFTEIEIGEVENIELISRIRQSVLVLQDNMIKAMQASCVLSLEAFNVTNQRFTEQHGKIVFENGKTDVHHLRVNEVGGIITVYKMNRLTNQWEGKKEFKPITKDYFNVDEFLDVSHGLTTELGGRGEYRIVYEMEDRESVSVIIQVTKAIVKPKIFIGQQSENVDESMMLNFNTETDGVFSISNRNWNGYFLQFDPVSVSGDSDFDELDIFGTAYIESASKGLPRTELFSGKPQQGLLRMKYLLEIYQEYGAGSYHITYVLNGQVTFADIHLFIELSITVFDKKIKLLPNQDNIIVVPANVRQVNLALDVPGGGLYVYDLDATSHASPASRNNGSNEFINPDGNPNGSHAYYKGVGDVFIDRDTDATYQDGHHYRFVYEHSGEQVGVVVLFEAPVVEVKMPSIRLFENGKLMEAPYVLWADQPHPDYSVEFYPEGATGETWVFDRNGDRQHLDTLLIQSDYQTEEIYFGEEHLRLGPGPYHGFLENDHGTAEIEFTLRWEREYPPKELAVKVSNTKTDELIPYGKEFYKLVYDRENKDLTYAFTFTIPDGELTIKTGEGEGFTFPVVGDQITFKGMTELPDGLKEGDYIFSYQEPGGQVISFNVQVLYKTPPKELTLNITNSKTKEKVESVENIYTLVYDYRDLKQHFQFTFSDDDGELLMFDEEGYENVIPVNGNSILFNGTDPLIKGLESGDYKCIYQSKEGGKIEFELNVINLNPTFILKEIFYKRPSYYATGIPLYPAARNYSWRIDEKFVSSAKNPNLAFNFGRKESLTVKLTMHLEDYEASYELIITRELIKKWRDDG